MCWRCCTISSKTTGKREITINQAAGASPFCQKGWLARTTVPSLDPLCSLSAFLATLRLLPGSWVFYRILGCRSGMVDAASVVAGLTEPGKPPPNHQPLPANGA
jgi:hypothetical protein